MSENKNRRKSGKISKAINFFRKPKQNSYNLQHFSVVLILNIFMKMQLKSCEEMSLRADMWSER